MKSSYRVRLSAALISTSLLVGGCGFLPIDRDPPVACSATVDVRTPAFSPAEDESFWNAARAAARQSGTVAMGDVVAGSGWHDAWDVMVLANEGINPDRLNRLGGAADLCWFGLGSVDFDRSVWGLYIFFRDGQPIRAVRWEPHTKLIRIPGTGDPVLRPDTVMAPMANPYGDPWLQPA
ncbi:hypothetical protein BFN03_19590 [Rhodococcus sp. WMMA185]|uniref:hypothetical protein n=1 Tax=Rhodococcus sp. WMMA185 TaxID=679318 RepID=UPI000878ED5A|nr:hypothetical protein [Rhodococcus sp. WMMA185]AOW94145.1 hypothetical protein BFN03_19590 [Rhodococcus sp. WMMA185]